MSGIYLVAWDSEMREQSFVLRPTRGGYPHCTLVYSGDHLPRDKLVELGQEALKIFSMQKMTLSKAYVNSFTKDDGTTRHDVLMEVQDTKGLEAFRQKHLYSLPNAGDLSMHKLHVTHAIFGSKQEAEERVMVLNEKLPRKVVISGVTID